MLLFIISILVVLGALFLSVAFGKKEGLLAYVIASIVLLPILSTARVDIIFESGIGIDGVLVAGIVVAFVTYLAKFGFAEAGKLAIFSICSYFTLVLFQLLSYINMGADFGKAIEVGGVLISGLVTTVFLFGAILGAHKLIEKTKLNDCAKNVILAVVGIVINFIAFSLFTSLIVGVGVATCLEVCACSLAGTAVVAILAFGVLELAKLIKKA